MSEQQVSIENSGDITADTIIKKIETLNKTVDTATKIAKSNLAKLQALLEQSGVDANKQKERIELLNTEIEELNESNKSLQEKAKGLKAINDQIQTLEDNINELLVNNEQITDALSVSSSDQAGGFQYNKKHSKHKRQFRLFSRSKTTPKKSKKRRRGPGKSVKKGGMKTRRRRRRRNKKSKKSKKRRK